MTRSGYTTSMVWVICTKRHGNEPPLFWSNSNGWVNLQLADIFTQYEHNTLSLPMSGSWMPWDIAKED